MVNKINVRVWFSSSQLSKDETMVKLKSNKNVENVLESNNY